MQEDEVYDFIIVGGGPVGMHAGLKAALLNHTALVLDKGRKWCRAWYVPRIDNIPGFPDGISGADLVNSGRKALKKYGKKADLKDFFEGPGKTCLRPGEIVEYISFPIPHPGAKGAYESIGRNKFGDLAIAAVTVLGYEKKDTLSGYEFLLTLTAVAPTVIFKSPRLAGSISKSRKVAVFCPRAW